MTAPATTPKRPSLITLVAATMAGPLHVTVMVVIALMLISGIFTPWGIAIGSFLIAVPFYYWGWPEKKQHKRDLEDEGKPLDGLEAAQ